MGRVGWGAQGLCSLSLTSLPCACRNSTSASVNVVMEMDLTRWGGFSPRLGRDSGCQRPPPAPINTQNGDFSLKKEPAKNPTCNATCRGPAPSR